MRQAGIIAAAGIYALQNNITRLKKDHEKALFFANAISKLPGFSIDLESVQTNIVIIEVDKTGKSPNEILQQLKENKILLTPGNWNSIRAVFHLDVSNEEVEQSVKTFYEIFK